LIDIVHGPGNVAASQTAVVVNRVVSDVDSWFGIGNEPVVVHWNSHNGIVHLENEHFRN